MKYIKNYWIYTWLKWRFYLDTLLSAIGFKAAYYPHPIFFIHIPKTAGTSFRVMLFKKIPQKKIFPNWKDIAENLGKYPDFNQAISHFEKFPEEIPAIIFGHFPFALNSIFSTSYHSFIFLREPIARTVSNLLHFQRTEAEYHDLSLVEIFLKFRKHLQNLQTRYLCDDCISPSMVFNHEKKLDENALIRAKTNLEKCTFIGITEKFEESIKISEKLMGIKLGPTIYKNVSVVKNLPIDPLLVQQIKPYLELDIELYQHALQLFEKQKSLILKK